MKEIFQRKLFWMILVILLLTVFIYPPFIFQSEDVVMMREWGWVFFPPSLMEVDLKMLFVEVIIAILLTLGIGLIPFRKLFDKGGYR